MISLIAVADANHAHFHVSSAVPVLPISPAQFSAKEKIMYGLHLQTKILLANAENVYVEYEQRKG